MWQFLVTLLLALLYPGSLLLPAVFGLVLAILPALLGTVLGDIVDRNPRFRGRYNHNSQNSLSLPPPSGLGFSTGTKHSGVCLRCLSGLSVWPGSGDMWRCFSLYLPPPLNTHHHPGCHCQPCYCRQHHIHREGLGRCYR